MSNYVEQAEWIYESCAKGFLSSLERAFNCQLEDDYLELYVDPWNRDDRGCGVLGEVYVTKDNSQYIAWAEWMNLYKPFDSLQEAKDWVERMASFESSKNWPEEIPGPDALRVLHKLQDAIFN